MGQDDLLEALIAGGQAFCHPASVERERTGDHGQRPHGTRTTADVRLPYG
jgi:hypothetical protein